VYKQTVFFGEKLHREARHTLIDVDSHGRDMDTEMVMPDADGLVLELDGTRRNHVAAIVNHPLGPCVMVMHGSSFQ